MVDLGSEVELLSTDFGLARWMGSAPAADGSPHLFCSPEYVSPETLTGHETDQRSDIYSLGATLFHLLTGSPPFTGDPDSMLVQHIRAQPPAVAARNPAVSAALNDLVAATLAKSPEDRPQDYEEFIAALDRCLGSAPARKLIVSSKRSAVQRSRRAGSASARSRVSARRRGMFLVAATIVVAVLVVYVVVGLIRQSQEAERRAALAVPAPVNVKQPEAGPLDAEAARSLAELRSSAAASIAEDRWGPAWDALAQWDSALYTNTPAHAAWEAESLKIHDGAMKAWNKAQAKALGLREAARYAEALEIYDDAAERFQGLNDIVELAANERGVTQEAQQKSEAEREATLRTVEQMVHGQVVALRWDEARQTARRESEAATNDPALKMALGLIEKETEGLVALHDAVWTRLRAKPGPMVAMSTSRGTVEGDVVAMDAQSITVRRKLATTALADTQIAWAAIGPLGMAQLCGTLMDSTNAVQRRGYASLLTHLALDHLVSAEAAHKAIAAVEKQAPEDAEVFARHLAALPAEMSESEKPAPPAETTTPVADRLSKEESEPGGSCMSLGISRACNAQAIQAARQMPADTFGDGAWFTAEFNGAMGRKGGIPDNGRIPIPGAEPNAVFRMSMPPDRNAIYISPQGGNYPANASAELLKKQQQCYSRMALLYACSRGTATVSLTLRYATGDPETKSLQIPHMNDPATRIAGQSVALTVEGEEQSRTMYSEILTIDSQRALTGFSVAWKSGRPNGTVGIFAVNAWPTAGKGRPRLQPAHLPPR